MPNPRNAGAEPPQRTFGIERGKRLFNLAIVAFSVVAIVGMVVEQIQNRHLDFIASSFILFFAFLAAWCYGIATMRVEADEMGLTIRDVAFRTRRVPWSEIAGFEVTPGGRAVLTREDGSKVPLIGQVESPVERLRGESSPTDRLVADLGELLQRHR